MLTEWKTDMETGPEDFSVEWAHLNRHESSSADTETANNSLAQVQNWYRSRQYHDLFTGRLAGYKRKVPSFVLPLGSNMSDSVAFF